MPERPWLRPFLIDGVERTDTTYRLPIVRHFTPIEGRTFLDVGAGDGHESRAVAIAGAREAVAVEGKREHYDLALAARDYLGLDNVRVLQLDARRIDEHGLGRFDVVLCFGFLYHMVNPFNLLKRLRNVTGELLLLETHVAPRTTEGLLRKHVEALPFSLQRLELDGVPFEGKMVRHLGDFERTKGSLDAPWTFWLTQESLVKALVRAGWTIVDYYHELDAGCPEPLRVWGARVGLGQANTKVWVTAAPREPGEAPVQEPVERILSGDPAEVTRLPYRLRRRLALRHAPA